MTAGRPTKYKPDFHPADCIRLGKLGKTKMQMIAEWDECSTNFNRWLDTHKEFRDAYVKACNYRTAYLLDRGEEGLFSTREKQMNHQVYAILMRYDGQHVDERSVKVKSIAKAKTNEEKATAALKAFANGELTPKELQVVMNAIMTACNVREADVLKVQIDEIKTAMGINK